mgnify:CR=1 FL=1|jgi:hypothetical protein
MAGAALSLFTDFFTHDTGPAYFSGPDEIINDAQLRNYASIEAFFRTKKAVQGGATIKDVVLLDDPGTAATYLPGEAATVTNVQVGSTITVPWRFLRVYITWTEAEILLNEGGGGGRGAQFQQYKNLKRAKYQAAYTSLLTLLEKKMVAAASNADMEANTGQEPYSLLATLTTDGLAPTGFTTVQGINPSTKAKWRNQTANWTAATPYDTDNGIVAGFDEISQLVIFKRPPNAQQYFDSSEFRRHVIFTNREGRRLYMKALRANNDITRAGPQDEAYGSPVFNNIPVVNNEGLDDASTFTAAQPGFLFINMNYLKMVFHRDKFMQVGTPKAFPDKPDTMVVWIDTYCNLFNQSRQRHGYLSAV